MKTAIARMKAIRARIRRAASVACSCRTTMTRAMNAMIRNPRSVGFMREKKLPLMCPPSCARHVRPHRERSCDQGSSGEPEQTPPPVGRGIEPRRQDGDEGERAVEIVEMLRRPPVIAQEQQPEPDLRDQHRLGKRKQMREKAAGLPATVVGDAGKDRRAPGEGEYEECDGVMRR